MVSNVWHHSVAIVIDKTLTAPLQYSRIFPDGVRMMTDILFLALWKKIYVIITSIVIILIPMKEVQHGHKVNTRKESV